MSTVAKEPFERQDLIERVAGLIRQAIFEQRLKPGDRILELDLAKELKLSRTPIREALRWLEREGLVKREPFRGIHVAYMTNAEVQQVFRIRAVLEAMAIEDARPNLKHPDKQRLRELLKEMEDAATIRDLSQLNVADMEFHKYVWHLSGDKVLQRTLEYLCHQHFIAYSAQTLAVMDSQDLAGLIKTHWDYLELLEGDRADTIETVRSLQDRWLSKATGK